MVSSAHDWGSFNGSRGAAEEAEALRGLITAKYPRDLSGQVFLVGMPV